MDIKISMFKSIGDTIDLDIAPLTVLLGPPASGKSNILDAIALLGYFNRITLVKEEYGDNPANFEPLHLITRFSEHPQLFNYNNLVRKIKIEIKDQNIHQFLNLFYKGGKLNVVLNGTPIPWDLKSIQPNIFQGILDSIKRFGKNGFYESRLYGYDRYGLSTNSCISPQICGFHLRLKNNQPKSFPKNILSEFGWNAPSIIRTVHDVIIAINRKLRDQLDEEVDLKVLKSGEVVIFDYGFEIDSTAVSDSIFRILYYVISLRSALNYTKMYGLEKRFILLLEEPEAHIFPFFLDLLVKYIEEAMKELYIVIATHNPIFVSMLWDKIEKVNTIYVTRNKNGLSTALKLNIEKLAKEMRTAEDILFMPPEKILKAYTEGKVDER